MRTRARSKTWRTPRCALSATSSGLSLMPYILLTLIPAGRPQGPSSRRRNLDGVRDAARTKQPPASRSRLPPRRKQPAARTADARARPPLERPQPGDRRALRRPAHRRADHCGFAEDLFQSRAAKSRARHPRLSRSFAKGTRSRFRAVAHPFRGQAVSESVVALIGSRALWTLTGTDGPFLLT